MAYTPLPIPSSTADEIRETIRQRLDPLLADVHAMMRLPLPDAGLQAGCNLSAALSLLEVVGGVSIVFYVDPALATADPRTQRKQRFLETMAKLFPWDQEQHLAGAITGMHAAAVLYEAFRNPLAHALGVYDGPYLGNIKVAKGPISESEVEAIEHAAIRPGDWTTPTLYTDSDTKSKRTTTVLTVKCLYWGVRQMVGRLLNEHVVQQWAPGQTTISVQSFGITATSTGVSSYQPIAPKSTS
jgi:hypothetical protein